MPKRDIITWAEGCLYAVGRSLSVYQSTDNQDEKDLALANARQEAHVLQVLLTEL